MVGGEATEPIGTTMATKKPDIDLEEINRRILNDGLTRPVLLRSFSAIKKLETTEELTGLTLTDYRYHRHPGMLTLNYEATAAEGQYEGMRGTLIRRMDTVVDDNMPRTGRILAGQENYRINLYDSQVQVFLKVFDPTTKR